MLVCSRTWSFTAKAEGKRQPGAAADRVTPGAGRPSQLLPGKAALTPFSGSGCLFLPHLTSTAMQPPCCSSGRAGHQGPLPYRDGDEVYCAELLSLLGKGKEHYWNQEGSRGCFLHMGAGRWPGARAQLGFLPHRWWGRTSLARGSSPRPQQCMKTQKWATHLLHPSERSALRSTLAKYFITSD